MSEGIKLSFKLIQSGLLGEIHKNNLIKPLETGEHVQRHIVVLVKVIKSFDLC